MASLATYFGLGRQTHRSLDDVRMNLEVLKYCATVLFLESSLPEIFTTNSWVSPNATTRSRSNGKASPEGMSLNASTPSSSVRIENHQISSPTDQTMVENHPILSLMTPNTVEELPEELESTTARADPFDMGGLSDEIDRESRKAGDPTNIANSLLMMEEKSGSESAESSTAADPKGSVSCNEFVEPDKVSLPSICVSRARNYYGAEKIQILWKGAILQLFCPGLKVRFGTNSKYIDYAGRPRLSLVVSASRSLCQVLDACDNLAQKFPVDSDRISEWKPVVTRKSGYLNSPTVRLHLPTVMDGNVVRWMTAIHQKESSTSTQKLVFSRFDIAELGALFAPGTFVDAYFSVDTYDYQQKAGIRLVAKKLVVHTS